MESFLVVKVTSLPKVFPSSIVLAAEAVEWSNWSFWPVCWEWSACTSALLFAKPAGIWETDWTFHRLEALSCQDDGSGKMMAVHHLFLGNGYLSFLWGPHQWAAWVGEKRWEKRRRALCTRNFYFLRGVTRGSIDNTRWPKAKWFGRSSALGGTEERALCKGCRSPGKLLKGIVSSAGPWKTKFSRFRG